ncbi:MAG: class II aldolase/adducin family protein [Candidatus Aenigmarchaeota archaeon]|nr:class II aldolase/adducin family protein [Candidatus Aenigmarchaeota archaeon]
MEEYVGVKFEVKFVSNEVPKDKLLETLKKWCKIFDETGLAPFDGKRNYGNLSFRTEKGFIITASGKNFRQMKDDDFVLVERCDVEKKVVYAHGKKEPSSESMMHYVIYQKRKDINAVFHGHDAIVLEKAEKLNLPITKEVSYGTVELVREVEKFLENDYIVLKNHGFVSLGNTMEKAGILALKMHNKAFEV